MKEPVLVTGATGFVGAYLLRRLLEAKRRVRVVVRSPRKLPDDVRDRIEVIPGDFAGDRARSVIDDATVGVGTVLHLAALARAWSPGPDDFRAVNVDFVRHLLAACASNGVDRLVHVSTVLTLPPYRPAPVHGAARRLSPYEATKREGERLVEAYAATGRHAVIVHPTRVYGPGPLTDANAVSRVAALYLKGRFRVRLDDAEAVSNYVHADDVARGILLAAERGKPGAHYILGGKNATFAEFLDLVGEISGRKRRVFTILPTVALWAARLSELWGRLGGEAPITPSWIRILLEDRRVDVEPCRRELGYTPRSLREGLTETIAWLSHEP